MRSLGPLLYWLAFFWRRTLLRTRFILITGSLGKTTTKEFIGQILGMQHSTFRSVRNQNAQSLLSLNILRVRPWHRFAVIEAGTARPGQMIASSRLLRPEIAVILLVAGTHRKGFRTLSETAQEKLSALGGLARNGTGIINADDQRLNAVPSHRGCRILRFGTTPSCDLHALNISSRWPNRLSFEVRTANETVPIRTQLVGTHWVPSLLASLLAVRECGIPLSDAAEIIADLKPFPARMQPVLLPSGATVIRDEYNGSPDSYRAALEFLESAEANRRVLIAGDYSDSTVKRRRRLARLGRTAARFCDLAIFVGEYSHYSRNAALQAGLDPKRVLNFTYPQDAVSSLKEELREGDLVLLKARSNDHLSRLLFAQVGNVLCWRTSCPERFLCDICWRLGCEESDMKRIQIL